MSVEVGKILEGKISGITKFGAFIDLPDGKTGLVHISEVAQEYVEDINSHLNKEQMVKVKVLSLGDNGKISLSIKKAMHNDKSFEGENKRMANKIQKPFVNTKSSSLNTRAFSAEDVKSNSKSSSTGSFSFEDRLSKFMKDSDERMLDVKRRNEAKRGSGRR